VVVLQAKKKTSINRSQNPSLSGIRKKERKKERTLTVTVGSPEISPLKEWDSRVVINMERTQAASLRKNVTFVFLVKTAPHHF